MVILGLAGPARSGKDSVAEHMALKHGMGANKLVMTYALADPIRKAAAAMFGLDYFEFTGENPDREVVNDFWGISPRVMLQKLGTECGREVFRQDIWLKRAELELAHAEAGGAEVFVISDIRFENEADWIRKQGGFIWHINRPSVMSEDSHVSENGIKVDETDYIVMNTGDLPWLFNAVDITWAACNGNN